MHSELLYFFCTDHICRIALHLNLSADQDPILQKPSIKIDSIQYLNLYSVDCPRVPAAATFCFLTQPTVVWRRGLTFLKVVSVILFHQKCHFGIPTFWNFCPKSSKNKCTVFFIWSTHPIFNAIPLCLGCPSSDNCSEQKPKNHRGQNHNHTSLEHYFNKEGTDYWGCGYNFSFKYNPV